jgi:hypothetical protein
MSNLSVYFVWYQVILLNLCRYEEVDFVWLNCLLTENWTFYFDNVFIEKYVKGTYSA